MFQFLFGVAMGAAGTSPGTTGYPGGSTTGSGT